MGYIDIYSDLFNVHYTTQKSIIIGVCFLFFFGSGAQSKHSFSFLLCTRFWWDSGKTPARKMVLNQHVQAENESLAMSSTGKLLLLFIVTMLSIWRIGIERY